MTFFLSIAKDILTRGYLYGHLQYKITPAFIILSADVYALNYIWRLGESVSVLFYLSTLGIAPA